MRKANLVTVVLLSFGLTQPSGVTAQKESSVEGVAKDIIALERAALDRYIALDPQGYLSLYAPEVTYFDPMTERRGGGGKANPEGLPPLEKTKGAGQAPPRPKKRPPRAKYSPCRAHGALSLLN